MFKYKVLLEAEIDSSYDIQNIHDLTLEDIDYLMDHASDADWKLLHIKKEDPNVAQGLNIIQ
jgi:hypothetical protein